MFTKLRVPRVIRLVIRDGRDQSSLIPESERVDAPIEEQDKSVTHPKQTLDSEVNERTKELEQRNAELTRLNRQLSASLVEAAKVFMGFIELRDPTLGGHARRVASLSKALAANMGLPKDEVTSIEVAALLHDIGKLGLPDRIVARGEAALRASDRAKLRQHPVLGQAALHIVDTLDQIGVLIRHHHEQWAGGGYPDGLKGDAIPLGSRIIAVANAFDHHRQRGGSGQADFVESHLSEAYGGPFDPTVIVALKEVIEGSGGDGGPIEVSTRVSELREGMVLARDLRTSTGILLIPKGEALKRSYLLKLELYEQEKLISSTAYVYRPDTIPAQSITSAELEAPPSDSIE